MLRSIVVPETVPDNAEGLWMRCRIQNNVGLHANLIEVMIDDRAFVISLLDCVSPEVSIKRPGFAETANPKAVEAIAQLRHLIDTADGPTSCWIPPGPGVFSRRRWLDSLKANSQHPGEVYLSDTQRLSVALRNCGVCRLPNRTDRWQLRDSNRHRAA